MSRNALAAIALVLSCAPAAQAQFSFGIGVGSGRGSSFYYGRGGGFYGPGYYPGYYGRGYYGPGYYGPGYGSGVGIRIGNFGYYDEGDYHRGRYYYSRPQTSSYYVLPSNDVGAAPRVLPDNKITPTKLNLKEGDTLIRSPADAPGNIGYGINDKWIYTIKPGEKQKLDAGRPWTIEFHRGVDGAEPARYALDPGIYEFHYSDETGWDLGIVSDSVVQPQSPERKPAASDDDAIPLPPEAPPVE